MKKNILRLGALLFLVCFSLSFAEAKPYFSAKVISPTFLDKPFDDNSLEEKEEIKKIIALQKNSDKKELEEALSEHQFKPEEMLRKIYPSITRASKPELYALLDRVLETADESSKGAKNYWQKKRPYLVDKRVKSLLPNPSTSPAYPSGHATESYSLAYVLGLIFPEKNYEFHKRAEEISQHRALVGMHFQRDLKGGKQLALLVVGGLLQNREFQKEFEKVVGK